MKRKIAVTLFAIVSMFFSVGDSISQVNDYDCWDEENHQNWGYFDADIGCLTHESHNYCWTGCDNGDLHS